MPLTIQQLREAAGGLTDFTDQELAEGLYQGYKQYYPDPEQFYKQIGYDPDRNFTRGLEMAGRGSLAAGAAFVGKVAGVVGADSVEDNLLEFAEGQRNRAAQLSRRSDNVDNFWEDPAAFLAAGAGQVIGYAVPSLLAGGAGGLAVRGLAGAAASRGAMAAGATAGSYGANLAQSTGGITLEQREQGYDDFGQALTYGAGAAALDTVPEALGIGRAMGAYRKAGMGGMARAAGKGALVQAPVESVTEVGQTALELAGSNQALDDDNAWSQYRNAAALGALGGGMFGAATGAAKRTPPPDTGNPEDDLLNPPDAGTGVRAGGLPPRLPYSPLAGTLTVFPDGSVALNSEQELAHRYALDTPDAAAPSRADVDAAPGEGPAQNVQAPEPDTKRTQDTTERRQPPADETDAIKQRAAQLAAAAERAAKAGVETPNKQAVYLELEQARDAGQLSQDEFIEAVAHISGQNSRIGQARSILRSAQQRAKERAKQEERVRQKPPVPTGPAREPKHLGSANTPAEAAALLARANEETSNARNGVPPAGLAGSASAGRSADAEGGVGAVRRVPAERDGGGADAGGVPAADGKAQPVRSDAAEQPSTGALTPDQGSGKKGRVFRIGPRRVQSGAHADVPPPDKPVSKMTKEELAAKEAYEARSFAIEVYSKDDSRFDNEDDFVDWALGHVGGDPDTKDAFKRVYGLGEYRGAEESIRAVAARIGGSDVGLGKRLRQMKAKVDALRVAHLMRESDAASEAFNPQLAEELEAAAIAAEEAARAEEADGDAALDGDTDTDASISEVTGDAAPEARLERGSMSAVREETDDVVEGGDVQELGLTVSDTPDSGGAVLAVSDATAARQYREAAKAAKAAPEAWNKLVAERAAANEKVKGKRGAKKVKELPTYDELADSMKAWLAEAEKSGSLDEAVAAVAEAVDSGLNYSQAADSDTKGIPAAKAEQVIRKFFRGGKPDVTTVVQTQEEAEKLLGAKLLGRPKGVTQNGERIVLIADNLSSGREALAVMLHEAGVHMGMQQQIPAKKFRELVDRIVDWATANDGSPESAIAQAALQRVKGFAESARAAGKPAPHAQLQAETVAYFVEEAVKAGVDPLAVDVRRFGGGLKEWFDTLVSALKSGLRKLFKRPIAELTAQDIVDIAYGMANMTVMDLSDKAAAPTHQYSMEPGTPVDNIPPPKLHTGIGAWIRGVLENGLWRTSPSLLGWLTTEQLADRFNTPAIRKFSDAMQRMGARANTIMVQSDEVQRQWQAAARKHGKEVETKFSRMLLDATVAGVWPQVGLDDPLNAHVTADQADAHARLAGVYAALPKEYKELFVKLQQDFKSKLDAKRAALKQSIIRGYYADPATGTGVLSKDEADEAARLPRSERRERLEAAGSKAERDALRSLWDDLDAFGKDFEREAKGPYFPRMRFGDHVVVFKSAAMLQAEQDLKDAIAARKAALRTGESAELAEAEDALARARARLKRTSVPEKRQALREEIEALREKIDALRAPIGALDDRILRAQDKLRELKQSGQDYSVEFFENIASAKDRERALKAHLGADFEVTYLLRDKYFRALDSTSPTFMRRLKEHVSAKLPGEQAEAVSRAINELYLQMLPDRSMLKAQMRRLGVAGVRADEAQRAYASSSIRDAWGISRLEGQDELREALAEMRFSRDPDSKILGEELGRRMAQNMQFQEHPYLTAVTSMTYLGFLGASPAFLAMNALQPATVTAPVLAARHGIGSVASLFSATKDMYKLLRASAKDKTNSSYLDLELGVKAGLLTKDEAAMLREQVNKGRIEITVAHDLGATAEGRAQGWLGKTVALASKPAQIIEMANRAGTALAAYRLERDARVKRGDGDAVRKAIEYADRMVTETHLNYAGENKARLMHSNAWGGWGRIMFQFRSYQQGMVYLVLKNMLDASRGDKEARKAVGYIMGTQMAAAGLSGIPFFAPMLGLAALIYKGLSEDDEEKDVREMFYAGLESIDPTLADAVMKGLPAVIGLDLSKRIGMGDIFNPVPYVDDRKEGRDMVGAYWVAMTGGAAAGMAANWAEALKAANQGDAVKAIQYALPVKALADIAKGVGYATEGLLDSRGRPIMTPEELGTGGVVARLLGVTPTQVSRTYERRAAFNEAKQNRDDVRSRLIGQYVQARMNGGSVADLMGKVAEFNTRHPDVRITQANLIKALAQERKRRREMRAGVRVSRRDEELARELGLID
jgi:hypothetical protein